MNITFENKVALITGATRGIGKQIAEDFIQCGATVILTGTKKDQVKDLNQMAKKENQTDKVKYYCVDFSNTKSTQQFLKKIQKYQRIDICVNNAGINRLNDVDKGTIEDLDDILNVNLRAPYLLVRQLSQLMKENSYGRIINISSIFGVVSREKRTMYSTSKFGLNGLTVSASNELARYNVLVNTVSPGFVLTDLTKKNLTKKEMAELSACVPQRRFAQPKEISSVVLFLASSFNTYLTGQNIIVDGGYVNV